ncbi:MAG: sigma 54-interacting transcriptional regulator [Longimicrobiaceae bacterium]
MPDLVAVTADDLEPAVRAKDAFQAAGYAVELLTTSETLRHARGEVALLVLTDGISGGRARKLLAQARERGGVPVVALVDEDAGTLRREARRLGAAEVMAKPADPEEVLLVGRRLIERERLRQITGIVGTTEPMEEALERVVQIAPVDSTVLIQGESGTGKELVARGLHALSPRRHRPFIAVNVAALHENLLESELFGHEKGAFTGASSLRKGFFELAHGGTVFLDEIGEMPPATQIKLLRVLEEREFRRVGGEEQIRVNVRVLAATNRDLRRQVELGEFRRDLYHRLGVLRIDMPPLRDRRADIPRLVERFADEFAGQYERSFQGLEPEALEILVQYDWPGNVRELRNLVESMVVLAPGRVIRAGDIPPEISARRAGGSLLPVPLTRPGERRDAAGTIPELEFVFRTLVELKIDVEDLRQEFEVYRERSGERAELALPAPPLEEEFEPDGVVLYRPGMSMREVEKEAIQATLEEVGGNRRKASEALGIGERTLYRKLREYQIGG